MPLAEIEKDMFKTISDYKAIGCKYIAVPYTDDECRPGGPRFAETIRNIYKFGRLCREAGIQLLYHNHDFEFTKISGMYGLDFIYEAVDACTLKTEIDTCWVKYAGENPAEYVKKYAGRCPVVHLKDYVGVKGGKTPYALIGMEDTSAKPTRSRSSSVPSATAARTFRRLSRPVSRPARNGSSWSRTSPSAARRWRPVRCPSTT